MSRPLARPHRPISRTSPRIHEPALQKAIRAALAGEPVVVAYVYGSHARGQADAASDVDVALLADQSLSIADYFDLRLRVTTNLLARLGDAQGVDVVVLQQAPLLLQYNALRNSVLVLETDATARRWFELDVERRYDDERPYLDRETDLILDRIIALRS